MGSFGFDKSLLVSCVDGLGRYVEDASGSSVYRKDQDTLGAHLRARLQLLAARTLMAPAHQTAMLWLCDAVACCPETQGPGHAMSCALLVCPRPDCA